MRFLPRAGDETIQKNRITIASKKIARVAAALQVLGLQIVVVSYCEAQESPSIQWITLWCKNKKLHVTLEHAVVVASLEQQINRYVNSLTRLHNFFKMLNLTA